jgi:putative membrane protein insertion efficiency factor
MMRRLLIGLIGLYQYLISPLKPPTCRFTPTCSHYACEVVAKYGVWRGIWLSIKRVLRCNPWNPGGYDPAP